jgi:beta-phosphoglucomutase-like phosphatase (HAD superfamily)
LLAELGITSSFTGDELRRTATGRNFRSIATDLASDAGVDIDEELLEAAAHQEVEVVTQHLSTTLQPDERVRRPLQTLAASFDLVVVSSSALRRLAVCFAVTGLDVLFPPERRFSAQDSLPVPTSKPDPAIYSWAGDRLGIRPAQGLAIEDAVPGVASARAAGFETLGNVMFVARAERAQRIEDLRRAGAGGVIQEWAELAQFLADVPARSEASLRGTPHPAS